MLSLVVLVVGLCVFNVYVGLLGGGYGGFIGGLIGGLNGVLLLC